MNITPISFKGLVGGHTKSLTKSGKYEFDYNKADYYPFKDESQKETDQFVKEHGKKFYVDDKITYYDDNNVLHEAGGDGVTVYEMKYSIKDKLPMTKKEYELYYSNPAELAMEKRLEIKSVLEEIKREKALNK